MGIVPVEAYARQLKQLLPRGILWNLHPTSVLSRLFLALAEELARIDGRAIDLQREWDPSTALETLDQWMRVLGIPEEGQTISDSPTDQRAAVVAKLLARGGQTPAYFVSVAARLGFSVTIEDVSPNVWRMRVLNGGSGVTTSVSRVGVSRVGDRLGSRTSAELERVINKLKPAHTQCLFVYAS